MSCDSGSQLTITSVVASPSVAVNRAFELARMLAWVSWTALGVPVDPDVSWYIAMADSSGCNGSMARPVRSSSSMTTSCPAAFSGSAASANGAPTIARAALMVRAARCVSANHVARSVRGVGCASIVSDAPRIHTA